MRASAVGLLAQAERLAELSRNASAEARTAAQRAEQAAQRAEQLARQLSLSAQAVEYAGEALRLAQSGDQQGALEKLSAAYALQQQADRG